MDRDELDSAYHKDSIMGQSGPAASVINPNDSDGTVTEDDDVSEEDFHPSEDEDEFDDVGQQEEIASTKKRPSSIPPSLITID